jgi:hypothetical protein
LELTLKTFPLSILGTQDGSHLVGNFIYSPDRVEEVCKVLKPIMISHEYDMAGAIMVMAPPPAFQPALLVAIHFLGDPEKAPAVFQSLSNLRPMMMSASTPLFSEYRDVMDYACAKGDYKDFNLVGIPEFKAENFVKVVGLFEELVKTCPDAGASGYVFEWHTAVSKPENQVSAFAYQDVLLWL